MPDSDGIVYYWDTSAIISTLFPDAHSDGATALATEDGTHLMSSLAFAESHAFISRIERDGAMDARFISAARDALGNEPWFRLNIEPASSRIEALAHAWPLRGADLWHLSAAKELQADLHEVRLISFDTDLVIAARGEGLSP